MDTGNVLWIIGQKGRIFKYDSQHDKFKLVYAHPELIRNKSQAFLNHAYLIRMIESGYAVKIALHGMIFIPERLYI